MTDNYESKLTIKTNNCPRPVLYAYELTDKERKEFDYIENINDDDCCASFFKYKGQVYHLDEFSRIVPAVYSGYDPMALCDFDGKFKGWQGYQSDNYFSGILVKYDDDFESVTVGFYYS